jgi:pimeloyl-ACP methyl ester carboxylesterase
MIKLVLPLLAAALSVAGCAGPAERPRAALAPACGVPGAPPGARCGTVAVPEDRSRPGGRTIPLAFVVVPAERAAAADPIFLIAGGPGQSATQFMPQMLPYLRSVAPDRDLVFLDQRGTGRSNPLTCPEGFDLLAQGPQSAAFRECLASLQTHADLRHYSSLDAVPDLETVRGALGYRRISLFAASYGVRVATLYMRRHPNRVGSAILRAAYPPEFNIIGEGLANADAELARVLDECAADPACRGAFPDMEGRLREVSARIAAEPERIELPAPAGGTAQALVTRELWQQLLYAMLLSAPTRQQIPLIVSTAHAKGFQPLAPVVAQVRDAIYGSLPVGMYLSVVCAEDAPRLRREALRAPRTPLGSMSPVLLDLCAAWPKAHVPASTFAPGKLDTSALILSGAVDPATTPASAERLARLMPNAKHLVFPATAHGPPFPPCAGAAIAQFLRTGRAEQVEADCSALRLPPFAVPAPKP